MVGEYYKSAWGILIFTDRTLAKNEQERTPAEEPTPTGGMLRGPESTAFTTTFPFALTELLDLQHFRLENVFYIRRIFVNDRLRNRFGVFG